ncbi:hypothetical protein E3P92_01083 [Wallemia ichthyophaga]|uniref:Uncharacterized protein n=2 Tax=Wallemia ichthyophaga TaxID=245174 RepID=A0A4T0H2T8_WALIC|nr:uncharacterized protein J056_002085 [Wallemia ichthyophaga EXF-994]TIA74676.1 hypothetical protein E3P91_00790 [Wallemia ichthyophaga]EOR04007.1 hypothetical protein J056_002085 [Wallemia ichthyophaga EXF-994]TIA83131.1 hypothetical protein E3P98_00937 [Wallemia ichthyophaga]TIA87275.1 hypothetical protein E3P97_04000 [Wallemia ichthyophaga]TIA96296.1 hypothetical protein E3P96_03633 [Wallemia ichthyophaga]
MISSRAATSSQQTESRCRRESVNKLEKSLTQILKEQSSSTQERTVKPLPGASDVGMILSDVDGTLLDDEHDVHPRTSEAIRYIRQNHPEIPVIPVTGKQRASCDLVAKRCGLEDMPSGCCHGSIIYTPEGQIESQLGIDPAVVVDVTNVLIQRNRSVFIYEHDSVNCVALQGHPTLDFYEITRGYDPSIRDVRGTNYMDRVASGQVVVTKMFLPMEVSIVPDEMDHLNSVFKNGEDYRMTRALKDIIELIPAKIDKSVALDHFSKMYNVEKGKIMTFGDGENDCGMFKASGMSVSMGNAMALPAQVSDFSTKTNNEGGVGCILDAIFRPEYKYKSDVQETDSGYASAA